MNLLVHISSLLLVNPTAVRVWSLIVSPVTSAQCTISQQKPVFDFYPRIELIMNLIAELFGFVNTIMQQDDFIAGQKSATR